MWTCQYCREVMEDQFDACWSCGCSRDGKRSLDSTHEPPPRDVGSSLEHQFAEKFVCQQCKHRDARVERIFTAGGGFSKLLTKDFLAVSCENCGSTQLFDLAILEDRSKLQNLLRSLFGV